MSNQNKQEIESEIVNKSLGTLKSNIVSYFLSCSSQLKRLLFQCPLSSIKLSIS